MKILHHAVSARFLLLPSGFLFSATNLLFSSSANAQEMTPEYSASPGSAPISSIAAPEFSQAPTNLTASLSPELSAPIETLAPSTPINIRRVREMQLPSELPSGGAVNDTIYFRWYEARGLVSGPAPAVILLHPLGRGDQSPMHQYARYLSARGISAAVITLPFHGRRLAKGDGSLKHFINPDADEVVSTLQQSVSDARTVVSWMSTQANVDPGKIGGIGISIGAIILHLVMGQDARVKAGVAALGGGALAESYRNSPLAQSKFLFRLFGNLGDFSKVNPESFKLLNQIDPVTFAGQNQPRRVLMIEAARDIVITPKSAETLWEALGKPPIQWVDANHFSLISFGSSSVLRASVPYLQSVWNGAPLEARAIPRVTTPTLKFGFVMNLDSTITPAVQWQFWKAGTYRHHSFLNANLGMSGRGPFASVAATVTPYLDIGAARRFAGNRIRPYASLHFVY